MVTGLNIQVLTVDAVPLLFAAVVAGAYKESPVALVPVMPGAGMPASNSELICSKDTVTDRTQTRAGHNLQKQCETNNAGSQWVSVSTAASPAALMDPLSSQGL